MLKEDHSRQEVPFACPGCGRPIPCRDKPQCLFCGTVIPEAMKLTVEQQGMLQGETEKIRERTRNFRVPEYDLTVKNPGSGRVLGMIWRLLGL